MLGYFKKYKLLLMINLLLVVCMASLEVLQALLFKVIIDTATGSTYYKFYNLVGFSLIFLFFLFGVGFFSTKFKAKFNAKIMITLKQDLFKSMLFYDNKFNSERTTEVISILTNDLRLIETDYIDNIILLIRNVILFIVSLVVLIKIKIWLAISIFILGWIPLLAPKLFDRYNQSLKMMYSNNNINFVEKIKEVLYGFEVIKGFGIEERAFKVLNEESNSVEISKFNYKKFEGLVESFTGMSGILIFLFNMIIAGYFVSKNEISIGSMIAAVQLMNFIINPLVDISKIRTKIKSVTLVLNKITDMISLKKDYKGTQINESISEIKLSNVSFSYDSKIKVVNNFNYTFKKGKKYAIVGPSGCGKTTLIKLLMKHFEGFEGDILINDVSLKDINILNWVTKISIIHQNVFLFNDTIRENICLSNNFSNEKISNAIKMSGLENIVKKMQNGIDECVGENGIKLSGGEKQRISIARSLLKESEILLIDEATASLDNIISREIEETILNLDKTLIMITHKYDETIMNKLDDIIVIEDGEVVETGTFHKLLETKGVFYNLYMSQRISEKSSNTSNFESFPSVVGS